MLSLNVKVFGLACSKVSDWVKCSSIDIEGKLKEKFFERAKISIGNEDLEEWCSTLLCLDLLQEIIIASNGSSESLDLLYLASKHQSRAVREKASSVYFRVLKELDQKQLQLFQKLQEKFSDSNSPESVYGSLKEELLDEYAMMEELDCM